MNTNIFQRVKQEVTTLDAARAYGIDVRRNGMACCPFHDDRHPSMKVDDRYHCFACGEDGDVIDFVGGLFGLRPIDAARKLAQDFGVPVDDTSPPPKEPVRKKYRNWRDDLTRDFAVLCDYIALLGDWLADYAPKPGEAVPHPNFIEACRLHDPLCHVRDTVLSGTPEEQQEAAILLRENADYWKETLQQFHKNMQYRANPS